MCLTNLRILYERFLFRIFFTVFFFDITVILDNNRFCAKMSYVYTHVDGDDKIIIGAKTPGRFFSFCFIYLLM